MLTDLGLAFVTERHLGMLSTVGRDGRTHAVPVGFTWRDGVVRIIGSRGSQKFVNAARSGRASVSSVDGARWVSFEGPARLLTDPESVALAVELYAARYREPRPNPERGVLEVTAERVLASSGLRSE